MKMKLLTVKFVFQSTCYTNIKQFSNFSKILHRIPKNYNQKIVVRNTLSRPKELDLLRKQIRDREKEGSKYKQSSSDSEESIGLYGYFLLSIPVITFGLGVWQIDRRKWKLNLIKDLEGRLNREPIEIPDNLDDLSKLDYCPIKAKGEFLYDKEFVVGPRSLIIDGHGATEKKGNLISGSSLNKGYNIITPFKLEDRNLTILVNRGWLPNKYKHVEERVASRHEGVLEITGINRLNEKRPQFVPKNEPEKGIWHYRDIYQMAEFADTEPVFLDRIESDPGPAMPIGSQTRVNLRNEHLSYIVTWFGLSALTGFYWYRIFIKKRPIF